MLRLCGAKLREVPAVPYRDPNNYVHVAERLAKELSETEPKGVGRTTAAQRCTCEYVLRARKSAGPMTRDLDEGKQPF